MRVFGRILCAGETHTQCGSTREEITNHVDHGLDSTMQMILSILSYSRN